MSRQFGSAGRGCGEGGGADPRSREQPGREQGVGVHRAGECGGQGHRDPGSFDAGRARQVGARRFGGGEQAAVAVGDEIGGGAGRDVIGRAESAMAARSRDSQGTTPGLYSRVVALSGTGHGDLLAHDS
ncbi:hypothetical protein [Nocardia beijingensis]|uniref:Uncharacterized protein n=1 Tax=Nocardia beijingensis TaxID=95162 RepID=A0ABW7WBB1_9NOCA